MFIQLKDFDKDLEKNDNIFLLYAHMDGEKLYISRSFADHEHTQYTTGDREFALVYFNRQAAVNAINTNFKFTGLSLNIEMVPVNGYDKQAAKQSDAIQRKEKNERRRARMEEYKRERESKE